MKMGLSKDVKPGVIIMLAGFLGIILAGIEKYMVDREYLLHHVVAGGVGLVEIQVATIILILLIGAVLAIITS